MKTLTPFGNPIMIFSAKRYIAGAALACLLCAPPSPAGEKKRSDFTLVQAVPHDVFVCVAERHNPRRQFLEDYWGEVFSAFQDSGIVTDVFGIVTSLAGPGGVEEADRLKDRFTGLISDVDWQLLRGREMVFAERLPLVGRHGQEAMMGQPEIVWLFRVPPDRAEESFKGLAAIGRAFADEVNEKAGRPVLSVKETNKDGVRRFCFCVSKKGEPTLSASVGLHKDVVSLSLGEHLFQDVTALLNGKSDKPAITSDPRFKAAFAELPPAADSLTFFDMHGMCDRMRCNFNTLFEVMEGPARNGDVFVNALQTPETRSLNNEAVNAYRERDYARALEIIKKAYEVDPKDSLVMYNLACFHTLNGNRDVALGWLEKSVEGGFYAPKQISTDPDLVTLRDNERYKAALAKAEVIAKKYEAKKEKNVARKLVLQLWNAMDVLDHVAAVTSTDEHVTRIESLAVLTRDAESKPIYPVVAGGRPIKDFDRYLPKETTSFSVNNGVNLEALYRFVESSVRGTGEQGEKLWADWQGIQKQVGLELQKDVLSWLGSDMVSVSLGGEAGSGWVFMIRVKDEAIATEKVGAAANFLKTMLGEMATQNPMAGMLTVRTEPCTHERLQGFQSVHMALSPQPVAVYGVKDGFLVLASSENTVARCFATAAGEHPNIRHNERLMSEFLKPAGPAHSISFRDQRNMGKELGDLVQGVAMGMGMAGMMLPNPKAQQTFGKVVQIVGKLGPVLRKIDFYKSTSSYTTFDGRVWRTRAITHYKSPTERATARSKL